MTKSVRTKNGRERKQFSCILENGNSCFGACRSERQIIVCQIEAIGE